MANGSRQDEQAKLMSDNNVMLVLGVLALGFYWAWIFACFSSPIMNPFGAEGLEAYLGFLVLAAGVSALSMSATAFFPAPVETWFRSSLGSILTAVAALLAGLPALMSKLSFPMDMPLAVALWGVGMCASSFVYLKTAPFLVWLKRSKLSRCIGLSFFTAAVAYLLAQVLLPLAGVIAVMLYPVLSILCSQGTERFMSLKDAKTPEGDAPPQRIALSARIAELAYYAPTNLIYSVSFGFVSCVVLLLAVENGLVLIIALSILLSAGFTMAYAFAVKGSLDAERFRRFLLPLIAIALLPFPYLPTPLKVAFLSVAVFGFTCFDAIGWGDLADEVRDRNLEMFSYISTAQTVGFFGIFIGWLAGFLVCQSFGSELDRPFGIISAALVIALILEVIIGDRGQDEDKAVVTPTNEFVDTREDRCKVLAEQYGLTAQETNIFVMLARGRNLKYAADELCISGHTVKTHMYHIYRKLDVHSQQELIDLVESGIDQRNHSSTR